MPNLGGKVNHIALVLLSTAPLVQRPRPPLQIAPNPFIIVLPKRTFRVGEPFQIAIKNTGARTVVRELHDCRRNWEITKPGGSAAPYEDSTVYCNREPDTRPTSFAADEKKILSGPIRIAIPGRYEVEALGARVTIRVTRQVR